MLPGSLSEVVVTLVARLDEDVRGREATDTYLPRRQTPKILSRILAEPASNTCKGLYPVTRRAASREREVG